MRLISKTIIIVPLCTISCICELNLLPKSINQLVKILKDDPKIDQVLLLFDADIKNNEIFRISQNISRIIPTQIAHFKRVVNKERLLLSFPLLQTTMILIIPNRNGDKNISTIYNVMDSVAELSKPKTLPKVLIVTNNVKREKYHELFRQMWTKQFLQVTIVEIKIQQESVAIYYYNPFTDMIVKQKLSEKSVLFPDKLANY